MWRHANTEYRHCDVVFVDRSCIRKLAIHEQASTISAAIAFILSSGGKLNEPMIIQLVGNILSLRHNELNLETRKSEELCNICRV